MDMVDLRNAFITDAELDSAQALLASHASRSLPAGVTDAALWDAKKSACSSLMRGRAALVH